MEGETFEQRMLVSGKNVARLIRKNPEYFKVWIMWSAHFGEPFKSQFDEYDKEANHYFCLLLTGDASSSDDPILLGKARILLGLCVFLTQIILRGADEVHQETFIRNVIKTVQIWT